ncbi:hypothetical protein IW262DRAFT_1334129 [Armillaria fumosa]|nr:hypothetical protein IW262DRAFT_1334129 [Armillaria fumosa]
MGTFDGQDVTTLPQIYKVFSITVRTGPPDKDGKFCIGTIPEWQTSSPGKTQHVVVIPVTPESGLLPEEPWIEPGTRSDTYRVASADFARLVGHNKIKLGKFYPKLSSNPIKVAKELNKHERQVRHLFMISFPSGTHDDLFISIVPKRNMPTPPAASPCSSWSAACSRCNSSTRPTPVLTIPR